MLIKSRNRSRVSGNKNQIPRGINKRTDLLNPRSLRITIAHNTQYSQKGRVAAKLSNSYALRQLDCHINAAANIDQQSLCTVPEIALLLNDTVAPRYISFAGSVPAQKGNGLSSLRTDLAKTTADLVGAEIQFYWETKYVLLQCRMNCAGQS